MDVRPVNKRQSLPPGWAEAQLGDLLVEIVGGKTPSRKVASHFDGVIPWFTVKDLKTLHPQDSAEHISEAAVTEHNIALIPANTLIVATRMSLGKAIKPKVQCAINQDLKALFVSSGVNSDFLLYWVIAHEKLIQGLGAGTTVKGITLEALRALPVSLPPTAEQDQIVDKLRGLLTEADTADLELIAAAEKLALLERHLLKAAMDGSLTAGWRSERQGPSEFSSIASSRVALIMEHYRDAWISQRSPAASRPEDAGSEAEVKVPLPQQPIELPPSDLPRGWDWVTLAQIGLLDRGRSRHRPRNDPKLFGGPYPFVQTGEIRSADTYIHNTKLTYSEAGLAQSRLWPAGTLCITIAANIGHTAILAEPACFPDSVVGFLPVSSEVSIQFIEYFLRTIQPDLEAAAPSTAQKNINLGVLERICVPLPPISEQEFIVNLLTTTLGEIGILRAHVEDARKKLNRQRKNLLFAAFAGSLVEQDADHEGAEVLLSRLHAEKTSSNNTTTRRIARMKPTRAQSNTTRVADVLDTANDWLSATEAFRRCGVEDGAESDRIESLYSELRALAQENRLQVRSEYDEKGRKTTDFLKLRKDVA